MLSGHGAGMSDYLTNLLTRIQHPERTLQPRVSSRFAPVSPASMGGEVSGWEPGEELYQPVTRPDLSAHQSLEATGQDREDAGLLLERETRPSEQASIPTPDGVRLTASSEAASAATTNVQSSVASDQREAPSRNLSDAKPIDLSPIDSTVVADSSSNARWSSVQEKPASWQRSSAQSESSTLPGPNNVQSSLASDQREAPSRHPSDAKAINLSPIDPSVVANSSSNTRWSPVQEKPASWPRSPAQSESSTLSVPNEGMNRAARGERASLRGEPSSQSLDIPSVVPTTQAHDQELNSRIDTRAGRGSALSSQQPLVGAPPARSDGEQLHRLPTIVNESGEALAEIRKQAAAGLNVSDISLDPSLVAPVRTTKSAAPSQHPMSRQPAGDASGTLSSVLDQQELNATPRTLPRTSNSFLARRRSVAPMTAASVSQVSATDRGRPAEPVVQVTIGRVEVRAMAPAVRQEKSRKPSSAMSLDDYLKRRGGRSGG